MTLGKAALSMRGGILRPTWLATDNRQLAVVDKSMCMDSPSLTLIHGRIVPY